MINVEVITHSHTHTAGGPNPNTDGLEFTEFLMVEVFLDFKGRTTYPTGVIVETSWSQGNGVQENTRGDNTGNSRKMTT